MQTVQEEGKWNLHSNGPSSKCANGPYGKVFAHLLAENPPERATSVQAGRSYAEGSTGEPCPLHTDPPAPPAPQVLVTWTAS